MYTHLYTHRHTNVYCTQLNTIPYTNDVRNCDRLFAGSLCAGVCGSFLMASVREYLNAIRNDF